MKDNWIKVKNYPRLYAKNELMCLAFTDGHFKWSQIIRPSEVHSDFSITHYIKLENLSIPNAPES